MEPVMQANDFGHCMHDLVREPEGSKPLSRHIGSHNLVMVEGHTFLRIDPSGLRLSYVVQQSCEAQLENRVGPFDDSKGVMEDVLVLLYGILFELETG